jgi:hypothetical protein
MLSIGVGTGPARDFMGGTVFPMNIPNNNNRIKTFKNLVFRCIADPPCYFVLGDYPASWTWGNRQSRAKNIP